MDDRQVHALLEQLLAGRLQALGMGPSDLTGDLDLVRSGLLDSLAFVDLLAAMEQRTGRQVDLEGALATGRGTRVGAVVRLFTRQP